MVLHDLIDSTQFKNIIQDFQDLERMGANPLSDIRPRRDHNQDVRVRIYEETLKDHNHLSVKAKTSRI